MKTCGGICCLVLLVAGMVSCASTPESRIKDNQAVFDSYPADVQAAIRTGQIRQGFDANQVHMALGEPTNRQAKGNGESWLYTQVQKKNVTTKKDVYKYELERKQYEEKVANGEFAVKPSMEETTTLYRTRVVRTVNFEGGKVIGWDEPTDEWLDDWHPKA